MTLLDVMTRLRSTRFPTPLDEFSVYTVLEGEPGERGDLNLDVVNDVTGKVISSFSGRAEIQSDRKRHVRVVLSEFRFPSPGVYRMVLLCDGETIAETSLILMENPP